MANPFKKKKTILEHYWQYLLGDEEWYSTYNAGKFNKKQRYSGEIRYSRHLVKSKSKGESNKDTVEEYIRQMNIINEMPYYRRKVPGDSTSLTAYTAKIEVSEDILKKENPDIDRIETSIAVGNGLYKEYVLKTLVPEYSLDTKTLTIQGEYELGFIGEVSQMSVKKDLKVFTPNPLVGELTLDDMTTKSTHITGRTSTENVEVSVSYILDKEVAERVTTKVSVDSSKEFSIPLPKDVFLLPASVITAEYSVTTGVPPTTTKFTATSNPVSVRYVEGYIIFLEKLGIAIQDSQDIENSMTNAVKEAFKTKFGFDWDEPEKGVIEQNREVVVIQKQQPDPDIVEELKDSPDELADYLEEIERDNQEYQTRQGYKKIRVSVLVTWEGHTEVTQTEVPTKKYDNRGRPYVENEIVETQVPIIEKVDVYLWITNKQETIVTMSDLESYYFYSYFKKDGSRAIAYRASIEDLLINMGQNIEEVTTSRIPMYPNGSGKWWERNVVQTSKKLKRYRRKPKNIENLLYEQLAANSDADKINATYLFHCFNLVPYLKASTRNSRAYRKYAQVFCKYFDTKFNVFKSSFKNNEGVRFTTPLASGVSQGSYRLRGEKVVFNTTKLPDPYTFIGTHLDTGSSLILYTHVPNYSQTEFNPDGTRKVVSITRYALDLTFWWNGRDFFNKKTSSIWDKRSLEYNPFKTHVEYAGTVSPTEEYPTKKALKTTYTPPNLVDMSSDTFLQQLGNNTHGGVTAEQVNNDTSESIAFRSKSFITPTGEKVFMTVNTDQSLSVMVGTKKEIEMISKDNGSTLYKEVESMPDLGDVSHKRIKNEVYPKHKKNMLSLIDNATDIKWTTSGASLTASEKQSMRDRMANMPEPVPAPIYKARKKLAGDNHDQESLIKSFLGREIIVTRIHYVNITDEEYENLYITADGYALPSGRIPNNYYEGTIWVRNSVYSYMRNLGQDSDGILVYQKSSATITEFFRIYHLYVPMYKGKAIINLFPNNGSEFSLGISSKFCPRLPLKMWYKTPLYVKNVIFPSTAFLYIKIQFTVKVMRGWVKWAVTIIAIILIIISIWFPPASAAAKMLLATATGAAISLAGALHGSVFLQIIGAIYGAVAGGVFGYQSLLAANVSQAAAMSISIISSALSLATSAYSIANQQNKLKEAKAAANKKAEENERRKQEGKEKLQENLDKVDLTNFNISISFDEDMDLFYWLCYGGLLYDSRALEQINYNSALLQTDFNQFDRFTSKG